MTDLNATPACPASIPAKADTILAITHDPAYPLFGTWLPQSRLPVEYARHVGIDYEFGPHIGLVVAVNCYEEPYVTLLRRAVEEGIPTLVLADGLLEYFNTWHQPTLPAGSLFQPVMGHKIACLGRSQARIIESWGNAGRCEVVGMPRLDRYATYKRRTRAATEPFRILITTKLRSYFTPEHKATILRSLQDIKLTLRENPTINEVPIEAIWRVSPELEQGLQVSSQMNDLTGRELAEVLQKVDAVITWPSTVMLEAMLLDLPVAVVDYCNQPHYVQAAWRISAAEHIRPVLTELIDPPAARCLFQDTVLHDALECTTASAPRLCLLAERMVEEGMAARAGGRSMDFSKRLLEQSSGDAVLVEARSRPEELYPDDAQFRNYDLRALQVENGQLRKYAAQLESAGSVTPSPEGRDTRTSRLIPLLPRAQRVVGRAEQVAVWDVTIDRVAQRVLFAQPPLKVIFNLSTGARGRLNTAVAMHPDAWSKVASCACEFAVSVDDRVIYATAIDPSQNPDDRHWQEIMLEIPALSDGTHRVVFETKVIGSLDYRWALWREPQFSWSEYSTEIVEKPTLATI